MGRNRPQSRRAPRRASRTPEQIKAARHSKPEDLLAWGLHLHLRGESAAEIWPRYFDPQSGAFKAMAVSANHKAMAATLALREKKSDAARDYWTGRFEKELDGQMGLGESRSNKYQFWSLACIALVWEHAHVNGDAQLEDLAELVYAGTLASWALGGSENPSRLTAGKWSGCYVSGPGLRSDPGHQEGDVRAWMLQAELFTGVEVEDSYRANARKRAASLKSAVSPADRKLASELWWLESITRARRAGLCLPEELAIACRACLAPQMEDVGRLVPALADFVCGTYYPFHFLTYPDGSKVTYLEGAVQERCIFADRIDPDGSIALAFPYPESAPRTARGGTCTVEDGRVVVRSQHGEASIALPAGEPSLHLRWGPEGLVVVE